MNTEEKKDYILKNWSCSNGSRIKEMLHRYWTAICAEKKNKSEKIEKKFDIIEEAKVVMGVE